MQQISFSDAEHSAKKKITKREKFLTEMNAIVPWQVLLKVIEPHYPVAGNGRAPYPLSVMLRIHLMQHWFNLRALAQKRRSMKSLLCAALRVST